MRPIASATESRVRTPAIEGCRPLPGARKGARHGMIGRKLLIALAAAALYAVVLVATASAEMHNGPGDARHRPGLTVTVDVPPGSPVTRAQIPGLPAPVQSIVDLGPVATPDRGADTDRPTGQHARGRHPDRPGPDAGKPSNQNGGGGGGSDGPAAAARATPAAATATRRPTARRPTRTRVNRADSNVRSGAGRAKDKVDETVRDRGQNPTARPTRPTRPTRSPRPGPRVSACRTSSSTSSASRRSCSRSTRPPASSTACAGRSWPRSTRSRPTTAATST